MIQASGYQNTIEKLYVLYQAQGFLCDNEAIDEMTTNGLSLVEISKTTDKLMDMGVIFAKDNSSQINFNDVDLSDDESDRSRSDYNAIFKEVIEISPGQQMLIKYIRQIHPPQNREWQALIAQMKSGNEYAFNRLFDMYLRVVIKVALYYHKNKNIELDDAIQEGVLGLMHGIRQFDSSSRSVISSYLGLWISQYINRAVDELGRIIRLPVHTLETANRIEKASLQLLYATGYEPTIEEIAVEISMPPDKVFEITQITQDIISFESLIVEENDDSHWDELIPCPKPTPIEVVEYARLKYRIFEALRTITDKESRILRLRFGLFDGQQHTLEEVGKIYGVTRERIRQIEAKALRKLQHPSRSKRLCDFLK
jgi:RNA polymerase primary sigma factor